MKLAKDQMHSSDDIEKAVGKPDTQRGNVSTCWLVKYKSQPADEKLKLKRFYFQLSFKISLAGPITLFFLLC